MINYPRDPRHRVIAQKSVFVRPPTGFIEPLKDEIVIIPAHLKQLMLEHLRTYHGISTETIYNDLHGFIRNQDIHGGAYTQFYKGLACQNRGDQNTISEEKQKEYEESIEHYTKAIDLKPDFASAYNNRGNAYGDKGDYDLAIEDYTKAIQFNPNFANAYYNRGIAYGDKGDYDLAIEDYTKAIQLKSDLVAAYYNRGNAYYQKGEYELAIGDFTKTIDLQPDLASAYHNRGVTRLHLQAWEEAKSDLTTARDMGMDIIASFQNDYESVSDFEGKHGIQLPVDIAAMLSQNPVNPEIL